MRRILNLCIGLLLGTGLSSQSLPNEMRGVYKYHLEDQEGLTIISPTHFIWIWLDKDRSKWTMLGPKGDAQDLTWHISRLK